MKKILGILMSIAMVAGFYACSSDDYKEHVSTLKVIESDLTFSNKAGSGYVEVESPTAITAKSSDDWCTATVNGTRVDVTVTSYPDIEARNAQIVIYNATDSVKLPVYQSGAIFYIVADDSYMIPQDGDKTVEITAKATKEYEISLSDDSWVHYTVSDKTITFTFDANEGEYRSSQFKITSVDGDEESVWFGQLGSEGFAGNYIAFFQAFNSNDELTWYYAYASVSNEGNNVYNINGLVEEGALPLTYTASTNLFDMKNGVYIGDWTYGSTTYYLYTMKNYTNAAGTSNYITYNTTSTIYHIYFTSAVDPDDGSLSILWTKSPSLSSTYTDLGFYIQAFKSKSFASTYNAGYLYMFRNLQMYRF
jgi:hypothetical protein